METSTSSAIHEAAQRGDVEAVRQSLDAGTDVNLPDPRDSRHYSRTPLHYAAIWGRTEVARLLLARGASIHVRDTRKSTPLLSAIEPPRPPCEPSAGQTQIANLLLDAGADVTAANWLGETALHFAVLMNRLELAVRLVAMGAPVNAVARADSAQDKMLSSPLSMLVFPNGQWTFRAASDENQMALLRLLLEAGAEVNLHDGFGRTPLYHATLRGNQAVTELLLSHGADPGSAAPDHAAQAKAASRDALARGCAAFLYSFGPSLHARCIDDWSGLLVIEQGDVVHIEPSRLVEGHNQGVREWIVEHGLPWNSRKPWLTEICEPERVFEEQSRQHGPVALEPDGACADSLDGASRIRLIRKVGDNFQVYCVELTTTKLVPGEVFYHMTAPAVPVERAVPQPLSTPVRRPVLGQVWSPVPRISEIWLCEYDCAHRVEFVWGPEGSDLAFFRFRRREPGRQELTEQFGVLDIPFGNWLPTQRCQFLR